MKKGKKLYEGKAKIVYASSEKNLITQTIGTLKKDGQLFFLLAQSQ